MSRNSLERKAEVYERVLHDLHFASSVTMNSGKVMNLLSRIGHWSFAHRAGNGELSDKEQQKYIDDMFDQLL